MAIRATDPRGYYSLGLIAERQQDWSGAEKLYGKSVEVDPKFANGHFNLVVAYDNQSKYALAIGDLKKVFDLDPVADDARDAH